MTQEEFEEKMKKRLPKIGAGAVIGGMVSPLPIGIVGNMLVGSAIGFVSDTDKFKDLMFGKEMPDGKGGTKRDGGILGTIKHAIVTPFLNLGKWVKTHISEGLGKRIPLYLPLIIVWTTTGMWHGSESRYVVWGLLNLFFVILGTEFEGISNKLIEKFKINVNGFLFKSYRVIKTFCLMSCLRLFDINKNTERAIEAFKGMFRGFDNFNMEEVYGTLQLPHDDLVVVIVAILFLFTIELIQRKGSIRERIFKLNPSLQLIIVTLFSFTVIVFGYYGLGFDSSSFIYGAF